MQRFASKTSCGTTAKTVCSEIEWGLNFRKKAKKKEQDLLDKKCIGKKKKKKKNKKEVTPYNPCAKLDDLFAALNVENKKLYADPFTVIRMEAKRAKIAEKAKKKKSKNKNGRKKVRTVDRDTLTHRQHIELLAKPRVTPQDATVKPKDCKKTKGKAMDATVVSPRLKQLALPSKRLVYANWEQYQHVLDTDCVVRMESILLTENGYNLDDREAETYFKSKEKRKLKVTKKRNGREKCEKDWLKNEVNILADLVVHSIATGTLQAENNRHIQLTNTLVATLRFKGYKIRPVSRKTADVRRRAELEILDHISVWSDRIMRQAEVLELEANVRRYERMLAKSAENEEPASGAAPEASQGSGGKSALKRETIDTLIGMLESGDGEALDVVIHRQLLGDATYGQLLGKLRRLRDANAVTDLPDEPERSLRRELMSWTKRNRPKCLSAEVKEAIEDVSRCLVKLFAPTSGRSSKQAVLKRSEGELLRSLSENVDLSDVPMYRDPNEDLVDEPEVEAADEEDEYFDESMFVGSRDYIGDEEDR